MRPGGVRPFWPCGSFTLFRAYANIRWLSYRGAIEKQGQRFHSWPTEVWDPVQAGDKPDVGLETSLTVTLLVSGLRKSTSAIAKGAKNTRQTPSVGVGRNATGSPANACDSFTRRSATRAAPSRSPIELRLPGHAGRAIRYYSIKRLRSPFCANGATRSFT